MKRPYRLIFLTAPALLIFFVLGCSGSPGPKVDYMPDEKYEKKVVIFYQNSQYKRQLIDEIGSRLKEKGVFVTAMDIRDLEKNPPEGEELLVIATPVIAWGLPGPIIEYIRQNLKKKRMLLIVTSGRGDMTGLEEAGDYSWPEAITGASSLLDLKTRAEKITQTILRHLEKAELKQ